MLFPVPDPNGLDGRPGLNVARLAGEACQLDLELALGQDVQVNQIWNSKHVTLPNVLIHQEQTGHCGLAGVDAVRTVITG